MHGPKKMVWPLIVTKWSTDFHSNYERQLDSVGSLKTRPLHSLGEQMADWTAAIKNQENRLYLDIPAVSRLLC